MEPFNLSERKEVWRKVERRRTRRQEIQLTTTRFRQNDRTGHGRWQRVQLGHQGVTLFVDNIHPEVYNVDLRRIFKRYGNVLDVYISRKPRKKTWKLFGFVRLDCDKEADEAIDKVNGWLLKGEKLYVKKAAFARKEVDRGINKKGVRRGEKTEIARSKTNAVMYKTTDGRSYREAIMPNQGGGVLETTDNHVTGSQLRTVEGLVSAENMEWLQRSLVVDLIEHTSLSGMKEKVYETWPLVDEVRDMGGFTFIITFKTIEAMEEGLRISSMEPTEKFSAISRWHEGSTYSRRRVWVEIFGIPVHLWCKENIQKIITGLGEVVKLHEETTRCTSLESAKALIQTKHMPFLEDHLVLTDGKANYEVFLKEIDKPEAQTEMEEISKVSETDLAVDQQEQDTVAIADQKHGVEEVEPPLIEENSKKVNDIIENTEDEVAVMENLNRTIPQPTLDDVSHLPKNNNSLLLEYDSLLEYGEANKEYEGMVGHSTEVADVSYNASQERELLKQYEEIVDGPPPGFTDPLRQPVQNSGPTHSDQAQNEACPISPILEPTPTSTVRKRGRPKKSSTVSSRLNNRKAKSKEKAVSSDEDISNEDEEAERLWGIAQALNLVANNKDEAVSAFKQLRRSNRGKRGDTAVA